MMKQRKRIGIRRPFAFLLSLAAALGLTCSTAFASVHKTTSSGIFGFPIEDTSVSITCGYGDYSGHNGYDLGAPKGTPIYALFSGNITYTVLHHNGVSWSYGNVLDLTSDDGKYQMKVAHLSKFVDGYPLPGGIEYSHCAKAGDRSASVAAPTRTPVGATHHVEQGELIGYSGDCGNSTGPHLHIEIRVNGSTVNPDGYISNSWSVKPGGCVCSASYAGTYIVTTESLPLNMRAGHSTSSAKVGEIPKGTEVTVTKGDGTWAHVSYGGVDGLVYMQYLTKKPDVARGAEMSSGFGRSIPDGDYEIRSALDWNAYLDIDGSAVPAADGTNVHLWTSEAVLPDYDAWTVTYDGSFFTIAQKGAPSACLDVAGADTADGTNIQAWSANTSSAQRWGIGGAASNNGYAAASKCSGYWLTAEGGRSSGGTNVVQHTGDGSTSQAWLFVPHKPAQTLPEGRYVLLSGLGSGLELDVSGDTGDVANGCNVQIWSDDASSRYNSFDVIPLSSGYYKLIHAASGKALDVYGGGSKVGQTIAVYDDNGSAAQQWAITPDGQQGGYILRPRCSGMTMDVCGAETANGTDVRQWVYNGSAAQTWRFVPAE